jgi:peroxiredoxin
MTPPVLNAQPTDSQATNVATVLGQYRTESGRTLLELVDESPVLLVFLRHFGCSFCRQTLDDVSQIRKQIEGRGVRPVFVHLGTPERAKPYFDYYHLSDIERVSDPEASLYASPAFQVPRKNVLTQFLVPAVWKGWLLGAVGKHGVGMIQEDANQMPAVFHLRERGVAREYRYKTIADRPDYLKLIG